MTKNLLKSSLFILIIVALCLSAALLSLNVFQIDNSVSIASDEMYALEPQFPVTVEKQQTEDGYRLNYKAFDAVPLKEVSLRVEDKYVYLGGKPLGITIREEGLIITAKTDVVTKDGIVAPAKNCDIKPGDILIAINGEKVSTPADIPVIVAKSQTEKLTLTIKRNGTELTESVTPAIDAVTGAKKIGLFLKEDIAGIGTLTYVNPENGRYGALGHPIKDGETGLDLEDATGNIYNSKIFSVVKGQKGKAGELSGTFNKNSETIGTVDKNNDFGIFGDFAQSTDSMKSIKLGSKYTVKPGKAQVYCTINGTEPDYYDVEIIKNTYQNHAKAKGIILRVTDERLLDSAGGIVQGMSGSPIIQNEKLVGAVTHVFINDPTKGYGVYIDWMLVN